ncbi:glycosyltransferase [Gottfriedia acidiceleris]|uniref:glycosyltransferase n=1 Tax=Gottfriedia acidiceleris TaxID=371036 RepID=UPI002FFF8373
MLLPGISVIIPSYQGENIILKCLQSLKNQSISPELFEIIIILNGEKDRTKEIVDKYINENNITNINLISTEKKGASVARNIGIDEAKREYITFLDDDDYFSENYLEEAYKYVNENTVVITQIVDVNENGVKNDNSYINKRIKYAYYRSSLTKKDVSLLSIHSVTSMNASKIIPTKYIKQQKFEESLKSGEDVLFFTKLFIEHPFKLKIVPIRKKAIYYRFLRKDSISRREMSFEFNVIERLDVIEKLNKSIKDLHSKVSYQFLKAKIDAQAGFIKKYIDQNKNELQRVKDEIEKRELLYFPLSLIQTNERTLVISYCFPPYVDTSGIVMAKRIIEQKEVVDVVYNNMSNNREIDFRLNPMVDTFISKRVEISSKTSFRNWFYIRSFVTQAMKEIKKLEVKNGVYQVVKSRVIWPGSNFLAFKYKVKNPSVKWIAEFSDPVLFDINSNKRDSPIYDPGFILIAKSLLKKKGLPIPNNKNVFFWCEYLAYAFADEVIFTNENQMQYMLETFPLKEMKDIIRKKAKIKNQSTLPKKYYEAIPSQYEVDKELVNIAYFGTFYSKRKINELIEGLKKVSEQSKKIIRLHLFTDHKDNVKKELDLLGIDGCVKINPYVSYLEFLSISTQFDCLIVNDAITKDNKFINPYLPSKLSDYLGSGSNIWGIYEEGSILSKADIKYKSLLGDAEEVKIIYEKLVSSKISNESVSN